MAAALGSHQERILVAPSITDSHGGGIVVEVSVKSLAAVRSRASRNGTRLASGRIRYGPAARFPAAERAKATGPTRSLDSVEGRAGEARRARGSTRIQVKRRRCRHPGARQPSPSCHSTCGGSMTLSMSAPRARLSFANRGHAQCSLLNYAGGCRLQWRLRSARGVSSFAWNWRIPLERSRRIRILFDL